MAAVLFRMQMENGMNEDMVRVCPSHITSHPCHPPLRPQALPGCVWGSGKGSDSFRGPLAVVLSGPEERGGPEQ
jgi:hypothetical protein